MNLSSGFLSYYVVISILNEVNTFGVSYTPVKILGDLRILLQSCFWPKMQRCGLMTEFDEGLWCILVESVTVAPEGEARFKDGREVNVEPSNP